MERISLPSVFLKDQASGSSDTLSSVVLCCGQPDLLTTGGFFKHFISLSASFFSKENLCHIIQHSLK